MVFVLDNYDSFTYNLVQYMGELGADLVVRRNDELTPAEVEKLNPTHILISPGPCTPQDAGISIELIRHFARLAESGGPRVPILGVCLGHQAIGDAFGGKVVRAPTQVHGKLSEIRHNGSGIFRGINAPFKATRYHSLVVERASMPRELTVTADTDDGVVMGLAHTQLPVHGVQFHPESIASEHGHLMLKNFLDIAAAWNTSTGRRQAPNPPQRVRARAN